MMAIRVSPESPSFDFFLFFLGGILVRTNNEALVFDFRVDAFADAFADAFVDAFVDASVNVIEMVCDVRNCIQQPAKTSSLPCALEPILSILFFPPPKNEVS